MIPIFSESVTSYSVEDAVKIILQPHQNVCTQQPIGCRTSGTFVVDLSKLDDRDDIKADDLGVWKNQGVRSTYCSIKFESEEVKKITVLGSKPAVMRSSVYRLKRTYWIHAEDNRVCRRIFELEGKTFSMYSHYLPSFSNIDHYNKMHPFCILQYSYPHGDDCKIKGQPHKNSKEKSPFNRSKKSVLVKIESEVQKSAQPTNVYNKVFQECGGVVSASSCGSLPRNRKQIANIKQKALKGTQSEKDPLFSVMEECKKEQSQVDPFLRIVQAAPDAMCLLVSDRQLHDMARFCTDNDQCSILGIDPTFNLGEFSVTVTTYRHLQLIERRTRKPPVLLGPMLIHQKKTRESYYFLASGILGLCPNLRGLVAFGTDGEKAIGEAFQMQFSEAKHLLCFIHVKDRLKSKLRDLGICGDVAKSFLTDIFGYQQGDHKFCGLVDCES